jgi:thioredoxin-related protein
MISPAISQVKSNFQMNKSLSKQNNPGHFANKFMYTMIDGRQKHLYAIDAKYTLLFFYNPECDACRQYKEVLATSAAVNDQIKKGALKVLAVYIDKDLSVWKRHLPEMPKNWLQGRDEDEYLFKHHVYDLHAIPTMYLLDRHKKVLLKDVLDIRRIEEFIN